MNRGHTGFAGTVVSWTVTIVLFVYPFIGLGYGILFDTSTDPAPAILTSRTWQLLVKTWSLSFSAALLSVIVALPVAIVTSRLGGRVARSFIGLAMLTTLLSPPMVYGFGWQRLLPLAVAPEIRCVLTWTLWAWPIPAWFIGSYLARSGRQSREAALLSTGGFALFRYITLPQILPPIALGLLLLLTLFLGEYAVPHACGLQVYATELLSIAQSSNTPVAVTLASTPCVLLILLSLGATCLLWKRTANDESIDSPRLSACNKTGGRCQRDPHPNPLPKREREVLLHDPRTNPDLAAWLMGIIYFAAGWLIKIGVLVRKISWTDIGQSWVIYSGDLIATLCVSIAAGFVSILVGLSVAFNLRVARFAIVLALVWGAIPGALVGEALVASYNRPVIGYVYDHWLIMSLCFVLHFGWVGIAAVLLARKSLPRDLLSQAEIDGSTHWRMLFHIFLPNTWPILAAGAGIVTVLSIADVGASTMVRVPSFNPIAHVIIEKFHRLEDGMMIALSLNIVAVVLVTVVVLSRVSVVMRRDE